MKGLPKMKDDQNFIPTICNSGMCVFNFDAGGLPTYNYIFHHIPEIHHTFLHFFKTFQKKDSLDFERMYFCRVCYSEVVL